MHIPDGILDAKVWLPAAALSAAVLARSVKHTTAQLEHRAVPVMGVMAAFIFAAQMINFPILGAAASGHLMGGALAAILFGFWPATLIMTTVVMIQALLFQDGGITALGVNLLNMAILSPAIAAMTHHLLQRVKLNRSVSAFAAGWTSVVVVSVAAAAQLALSGAASFAHAASALLFWHSFIGVGEGLITAVVLPFALRSFSHIPHKETLTYES
ncbi:energy-coupling factor ABC transporter permease [Paenibacillus sp. GCM10023252]|uniref:energy-coupling factor ABC transporter permease n=1 Tax=Paenibacillus sp. GCM10023252 TaxID=3252649 RepID=UPI00360EC3B0